MYGYNQEVWGAVHISSKLHACSYLKKGENMEGAKQKHTKFIK